MSMVRHVSVALALVLGLVATTRAGLITNGSFEAPALSGTGDASGAGFIQEGAPATGWTEISVAGMWSHFGGGVLRSGSVYDAVAEDGVQMALLKGPGGMSQVISGLNTTNPCTLSFYATARDLAGNNANPFQVLIDGTALTFNGSTTITPATMIWASQTQVNPPYTGVVGSYTLYSTTFTPTSPTMALSFVSTLTTGTDLSTYVDNVQLTQQTPEPTTSVLLLTALIGLLAYAWKGRK